MIKLTRIHGDPIYVHEGNIQWIENLPDTTITMMNGARFIVKESVEEISERIKQNIASSLCLSEEVTDRAKATENLMP